MAGSRAFLEQAFLDLDGTMFFFSGILGKAAHHASLARHTEKLQNREFLETNVKCTPHEINLLLCHLPAGRESQSCSQVSCLMCLMVQKSFANLE